MVDEVDKPRFELPFGRINRSASSQDNFRQIPVEEPSFLAKAGAFAKGFGLGSVGAGEGYVQSLRDQRQQKNMQLLQATVMDANSIQDAIRKENMPKAVDILVDRMNLLEEGGEDYEDTKMLRDALIGGRPDIVMSEIDTFLKGLPEQTIDPKFVTGQGQMISRRMGGAPTATTISGYQGEAQDAIRPMTDAEMLQYRIPTGSSATINTRTGEPNILASAESADDYKTYTSNGIERYADGPYAGYSLGRVAEMRRKGEISGLGNALPSSTLSTVEPRQEVRPSPAETPNLYAGLSSQESAILQAAQEQEEVEQERATAEEARRVAVEKRAVSGEERTAAVSEEQESLGRNEALSVLGLLRGRFLNPQVYGDSIYNAATGPIEGNQEGASLTSYLPNFGLGGASPQEVTNFTDDFANLNNLLTVGGLGRMTGVLSESDIKLIRDAASGLKRTSSPELIKARMVVIEGVIAKRLKDKYGMTDADIQNQLPVFSMGGGELDAVLEKYNRPTTDSSTGRDS